MMSRVASFIKSLFNKTDAQKEAVANFHTTIIRVDNNYISSSAIVVDEILVGNIYSLKEVKVANGAEISGNIMSRTASIDGRVDGDVVSVEFLDIGSRAIINGNIHAKAMSIAAGALINGSIRTEGNIDERDLISKVENRVPVNALNEHAQVKILPEPIPTITSDEPGDTNGVVVQHGGAASKPRVERTIPEPVTSGGWY